MQGIPGEQPEICLQLCETLHPLGLPSSLLLHVVRRGTMAMHPLLNAQSRHQALCQTGHSKKQGIIPPSALVGPGSSLVMSQLLLGSVIIIPGRWPGNGERNIPSFPEGKKQL